MTERDLSDPQYVGPGVWLVIHQQALLATTPEQQEHFLQLMDELCDKFPCPKCRGHCLQYLEQYPPEDYCQVTVEVKGEERPLGLFLWSWNFHNAVNSRLGKRLLDWETAYNLYQDHGKEGLSCSKVCLASGEQGSQAIDLTSVWDRQGSGR